MMDISCNPFTSTKPAYIIQPGDIIAVWFSCGAASAVACKLILNKYSDIATIRILNNPIKEEHSDNQRFLKDVEQWLNHPIEHVINPKYPNQSCAEVWDKRKFMSGPHGAPCTIELKKNARYEYEESNLIDWHVLGFTLEERYRAENLRINELDNLYPILVKERIKKKDCFRIIQEAGIDLPAIYKLGYPNANCIGCVKASSPTYWNLVRCTFPDVFTHRAEQSRQLGAKLVRVKGKRIFLDELDPSAKGAPLKNMNFECGIFCEK